MAVNEPARELVAPLLNEVGCKAVDALTLARHINNSMFGRAEQTAGKEANPSCVMDLLINHNICLSELLFESAQWFYFWIILRPVYHCRLISHRLRSSFRSLTCSSKAKD
jgi:hypothetical protein